MIDDIVEPVPVVNEYYNRHEGVYYKLEFRNLWTAVKEMCEINDELKYDELTDNNKNNLKTIFQQIGEESLNGNEIVYIATDYDCLRIKTINKLYLFDWEYESVRFVKYYNDD